MSWKVLTKGSPKVKGAFYSNFDFHQIFIFYLNGNRKLVFVRFAPWRSEIERMMFIKSEASVSSNSILNQIDQKMSTLVAVLVKYENLGKSLIRVVKYLSISSKLPS